VPDRLRHDEEVMGTVVSFDLSLLGLDQGAARRAIASACRHLHHVDEVFSTYRPESAVSRLRTGSLSLDHAPSEVHDVIVLCLKARDATGGLFDPWSLPEGFDPTGLVKGWAIEGALEVLRMAGAQSAAVNGGGDVAVLGSSAMGAPWEIGIRHPWRSDALAAVVLVTSAVATSGSYERGLHLRDPRTGSPTVAAASATAVGPSLTMADAFATALAVGGDAALEIIEHQEHYEGYLIDATGQETWTMGFPFRTTASSDAPTA
jgi:thiamine biosynthesis lipoprotein